MLYFKLTSKDVGVKNRDANVVIVGAGLAGLACAMTLQKHGCPFLLLEKSEEVGGRLRSSSNDGFLFDHGFQVLLTSYPELKHFVDLDALDLQNFNSGALIYTPEKMRLLANPLVHPNQIFSETLSSFISLKDKSLVVKLILSLHASGLAKEAGVSTIQFLRRFGYSDEFIENFWRPFWAGIFLDKNLEVQSDFFIFLLKHFSSGRVAVPKRGMQEIPRQMSRRLNPSNVRMSTDIKEISSNGVVLESGESILAKAVVCAFNPIGNENGSRFRSVINYYFSTLDPIPWEKWLVLVPSNYNFHINNIAVMSQVSETYSRDGSHLLSVSVIGDIDPGVEVIAKELVQIAGFDLKLRFLQKYNIQKALPKKYRGDDFLIQNGIFYCGDYLSSPSINGALRSGRLAAEKLLTSLEKS